jgi:hypothetical protein
LINEYVHTLNIFFSLACKAILPFEIKLEGAQGEAAAMAAFSFLSLNL